MNTPAFSFHHVAISVRDIEQSKDFYEQIFGFELYQKYDTNDMKIYLLKLNSFTLELFWFKEQETISNIKQEELQNLSKSGVKHFALKVDNLEEVREYLIQHNVEIYKDITIGRNPLKYLFLKDPNGIQVEIVEEIQT